MLDQQETQRTLEVQLGREKRVDQVLESEINQYREQPAQQRGIQRLQDREQHDATAFEPDQPQHAQLLALAIDVGPQARAERKREPGGADAGDDPEDHRQVAVDGLHRGNLADVGLDPAAPGFQFVHQAGHIVDRLRVKPERRVHPLRRLALVAVPAQRPDRAPILELFAGNQELEVNESHVAGNDTRRGNADNLQRQMHAFSLALELACEAGVDFVSDRDLELVGGAVAENDFEGIGR